MLFGGAPVHWSFLVLWTTITFLTSFILGALFVKSRRS